MGIILRSNRNSADLQYERGLMGGVRAMPRGWDGIKLI
jgi:hypothetical protein